MERPIEYISENSVSKKKFKPNSPECKQLLERTVELIIQDLNKNQRHEFKHLNNLEKVNESQQKNMDHLTYPKNLQAIQSVNGLIGIARFHWKKYLPAMYKDLLEKGELESAIQEAAESTLKSIQKTKIHLIQNHPEIGEEMALNSAWEVHREEMILLEPEE